MMNVVEAFHLVTKYSAQELEEHLKSKPLDKSFIGSLFHAAYDRKKEDFISYIDILMPRGADINEIYYKTEKMSIFMAACKNAQNSIVRKMLDYSPDLKLINAQGDNVLILSLNSKNLNNDLMKLMISRQPSLVQTKNIEKNPLMIATKSFNKQIIQTLLEHKADPNLLDSELESVLHILAKKFKNKPDQIQIIKKLIQCKIDTQLRNNQGRSALDIVPQQFKKPFQQLISIKKQEQKKVYDYDRARELTKLNNNKIKHSMKQIVLNNKTDDINLIQKAAVHLKQYLLQKANKLRAIKKQKQEEYKRAMLLKQRQNERRKNLILPTEDLKYYLEEEIKLFSEQIEKQNESEKELYDKLIQNIRSQLENQLSIQVKVYGSYVTRLCLPDSDIDVVVLSKIPITTKQDTLQLLQKIRVLLSQLPYISTIKFITSAAFPVIKVVCSEQYNHKRIDITLRNQSHNGLRCIEMIQQFMKQYEQLRPLVFVLKTFIYSSELQDTYQGGLSSYGLILMIVFILKEHYVYKHQKLTLGELLIKFLQWFGLYFDYINKVIVVSQSQINPAFLHNSCIYTVDTKSAPLLNLTDPLNIDNNVGRSTYKIKQIQKAFSSAYVAIHTNYSCLQDSCQYRHKIQKCIGPKSDIRPCCILKRMFVCAKSL